jgi:pilus assembly protein Flp/PilA
MLRLINRFRRDERGATATEYAMLVVFIGLIVAVGAQTLGLGIKNLFTNIGSTLTTVSGQLPAIPNPSTTQ